MRSWVFAWVVLAGASGLASCTFAPRDPVVLPGKLSSQNVVLDLRSPALLATGSVIPGQWAWDANVLWAPTGEGRPTTLLPPMVLPGPETGGTLVHDLVRPYRPNEHGGLTSATASLEVLVPGAKAVLLRIGSFPGAQRVWVNGVVILERGVLSLDPEVYRAGGGGEEVQVQPVEGHLSLVVNLVTNNPLVKHRELNRLWSLASGLAPSAANTNERVWRAFQVAVLGLVCVVFLLIGTRFRPESGLIEFGLFLLICLLKLLFNVEETRTVLSFLGLEIDQAVLLFVNHGLNLVPFVLFLWFLNRRFPDQIPAKLVLIAGVLCLVLELWELFPFVALVYGWAETYDSVMASGWSLVLNVAVVLSVLLIFERLFQIDRTRKPLGRMLFGGGVILGLVIMVPVILSLFSAVPFALYLGTGLFFFLLVASWELIRVELVNVRLVREGLELRTKELEALGHFFPENWAARLGRKRTEDVQPGDRRLTEAVVVQMTCEAPWDEWLPVAQGVAALRKGVFVDAQGIHACWILDSRPENALAFALEVHAALSGSVSGPALLVATKSVVELSVLEAGNLWIRRFEPLPTERLAEMLRLGRACGAGTVLDVGLKDGLVVGGWRKHRLLSPDGQAIELFEGDTGPVLANKLATVSAFEQALQLAAEGQFSSAVVTLLEVLRLNPLDEAARHYLDLWQAEVPRPH